MVLAWATYFSSCVQGLTSFQELKCSDYQLAVQALAAESKLHKLFDETRHEGKNVMDYESTPTDSAIHALSSGPSVSLAGDTELGSSSDMSISSEESDGSNLQDFAIQAGIEERAPCVLVTDDGDPNWEDDEFMLEVRDLDEEETVSDRSDFVPGEDEDDSIDREAYDSDLDANGIQKSEQAGVIHLVQGWTQRGHPDQVRRLSVF
jgi:hypothetical protein